jgi:hypothetical protein
VIEILEESARKAARLLSEGRHRRQDQSLVDALEQRRKVARIARSGAIRRR